MSVRVKLADSPAEWMGAVAVRIAVFVGEQGVPFAVELDEHDSVALHAVAVDGDRVVGTGRLFEAAGGSYRLGRLAVLRPWRAAGVGARLLRRLEETARARGAQRIVLHAQTYVESFYAKHGYAAEQPRAEFLEDGIPHVRMSKPLTGET